MEGKKFSLKNVISNAIASTNGRCKKVFAVSIMQYMAFLLVYLFTRSLLIAFSVYALFLPSMVKFLTNMEEGKAENIFKVGKNFASVLAISLLYVFAFGIGLILLIFPAIIFFANYALVFEEAKNGDKDVLSAYKDARESVKGYRGKLVLLCLAFALILILLVGLGILISWLFSLFMATLNYEATFFLSFINLPFFYYFGTILGVSAFLIFALPIELLAISQFKGEIAQDKIYRENEAKAKEEAEKAEEAKAEEEKVEEEPEEKKDEGYIS